MDYRLDCEVRITDHHRYMAEIDAGGWKKPTVPRYRIALAQMLLALAVRIAPTVPIPSLRTQAMAR